MNLAGFKEFVPTLFVFKGIFDGDVTRSLLEALLEVTAFSWFCFFEFQVLFVGDVANLCIFDGEDFVTSLERSLRTNCGVLSGLVGVPWIGDSLLGVLIVWRRDARFAALLLLPEAFKRFLESFRFKRFLESAWFERFLESTWRTPFGEVRCSVDLLREIERCLVG